MIDRKQIETILRANGVAPTADDEQIRSILLSAKWDENKVDTALTVLKENTSSHQTHIDTLHKVFRSDETLSPQEISSLLGIDVKMPTYNQSKANSWKVLSVSESTVILFTSFFIAFVSIAYVMYSQEIGPFYEPTPYTQFDN